MTTIITAATIARWDMRAGIISRELFFDSVKKSMQSPAVIVGHDVSAQQGGNNFVVYTASYRKPDGTFTTGTVGLEPTSDHSAHALAQGFRRKIDCIEATGIKTKAQAIADHGNSEKKMMVLVGKTLFGCCHHTIGNALTASQQALLAAVTQVGLQSSSLDIDGTVTKFVKYLDPNFGGSSSGMLLQSSVNITKAWPKGFGFSRVVGSKWCAAVENASRLLHWWEAIALLEQDLTSPAKPLFASLKLPGHRCTWRAALSCTACIGQFSLNLRARATGMRGLL